MAPLFDPANSVAVGAYGLLLSIFGTFLTLLGLYFTFRQARKAASSAEIAISAVRDFKFRVTRQDAARDISEAAYALDVTRRYLNNSAWSDAVDSYEDARRAFVRIGVTFTDLSPDKLSALRKSIEQMAKFCEKIDAAISGKGDFPDPTKAKAIIRRNYELLASIQKSLEESPQI